MWNPAAVVKEQVGQAQSVSSPAARAEGWLLAYSLSPRIHLWIPQDTGL